MYQDYFEYDGVQYPSGTQIKLLKTMYNGQVNTELAYFMYVNKKSGTVWCQMAYTGQNRGCSMDKFMAQFGGVTGKIDPSIHPPQCKQLKDSQIPGMMLGWLWYIVIMAVAVIFKEAIGIWVIASIVFLNWRKNKIEKEGYYVER